MPTTIKLKNSVTTTNAPTSLVQGEVAINVTDKKVWVGNAATTPVLLLGSGADGTFTNLTVSGVASFADGTVSLPSITNIGDTNTGIFFPAADTIAFTEGGVESMRITSAGDVGIGTNSPTASRLHIAGYNGGTTYPIRMTSSNSGVEWAFETGGSAAGSSFLAFRDIGNSAERMRIDNSGNVGIGLSNGTAKLTVAGAGANNAGAAATYIGSIQINEAGSFSLQTTGGLEFKGSVFGAGYGSKLFSTDAGDLLFGNRANSATWSERMRIDSSGNVGIGTSSPIRNLQIGTYGTGTNEIAIASATNGLGSILFGDGGTGANVYRGYLQYEHTNDAMVIGTASTERMRIDSSGNLLVGKTSADITSSGFQTGNGGSINFECYVTNARTDGAGIAFVVNRQGSDGTLVGLYQANTQEGSISVSGTTVSYNGGHLARWSQLLDGSKDSTILKGTILSNLDEMCVWEKDGVVAENEQLNKMKISDVEGDTNVAGVFVNWTRDENYDSDDMNIAMTGDMIIRIAQGVTVNRGDLLMSAGDGTAKTQGDDIVRSKTIAKVTSTHITCTYADGSYCVPCVLMAC